MKGLLHRLAARAAGTAPIVRSNATLPWQAGSLVEPRPVPMPAASAPSDTQRARPRHTARSETHDDGDREIADHAQRDIGGTTRPLPTQNEVEEVRAVYPEPSEPPRTTLTSMEAESASDDRGPVALEARVQMEPMRNRIAPPGEEKVLVSSPRTASESREEPLRVDESGESQRPAVSVTAVKAKPLPQQPAPSPEHRGSEAPTEVHVHIGRVDVTAIRESPRTRRKSEPRSAISLDAYLSSRSRS